MCGLFKVLDQFVMQLRLRKDIVFTLLCKIMVTNPKFHTWYIEDSHIGEFQANKQKY
jgi:hypothetical protein